MAGEIQNSELGGKSIGSCRGCETELELLTVDSEGTNRLDLPYTINFVFDMTINRMPQLEFDALILFLNFICWCSS